MCVECGACKFTRHFSIFFSASLTCESCHVEENIITEKYAINIYRIYEVKIGKDITILLIILYYYII